MKTLDELVNLANKALVAGQGSPEMVDFRVTANPDNILAIAAAFRALEQRRDALATEAVLKSWVACSPEWIERNGACSCETAPRIAFGDIGPHYHPHSFAQATDAYLNSVRAEGVEALTKILQAMIDAGDFAGDEIGAIAGAVDAGNYHAAQLRAGEQS